MIKGTGQQVARERTNSFVSRNRLLIESSKYSLPTREWRRFVLRSGDVRDDSQRFSAHGTQPPRDKRRRPHGTSRLSGRRKNLRNARLSGQSLRGGAFDVV